MSDDLNFRMTDLEERLASADGPMVQADVLQTLAESGESVAKKIEIGLPPTEFEKAQTVHQALAAAHEIITAFPVIRPEENPT